VTEVWIEAVVRFDPHFSIEAGANAGASLKLLHVGVYGSAGRFGLNLDGGNNGTMHAEGPNDDYDRLIFSTGVKPSSLFDGQWHVIRYHIRLGSTDMHE